MKAMILAAGRGERLRPLTDTTPKPLVQVGRYRLIEWHLHRLCSAGFKEVVINVSHLADQIINTLCEGERYGLKITYSQEPEGALETGGGIFQALDLLGPDPFAVINGDIWTDYPFENLTGPLSQSLDLAHLVMIANPEHNPAGDFCLQDGKLTDDGCAQRHTFSGIGLYRAALFDGCQAGRFALAPILRQAMSAGQVSGELFGGHWYDIGTQQRLRDVRELTEVKK